MNPTPFLNRVACKKFLLEYAQAKRAQRFTRVSSETMLNLNELVRANMINHVHRMPSKGKTL